MIHGTLNDSKFFLDHAHCAFHLMKHFISNKKTKRLDFFFSTRALNSASSFCNLPPHLMTQTEGCES